VPVGAPDRVALWADLAQVCGLSCLRWIDALTVARRDFHGIQAFRSGIRFAIESLECVNRNRRFLGLPDDRHDGLCNHLEVRGRLDEIDCYVVFRRRFVVRIWIPVCRGRQFVIRYGVSRRVAQDLVQDAVSVYEVGLVPNPPMTILSVAS
jgi:hypothetical protein